jgi:hypothetical protein
MAHTPSAKKTGLINRLAGSWIQEIGLSGFVGHPEELFEHPEVVKRVNRLNPATLGIIAWKGIEHGKHGKETSMYEVHCGSYCGKYLGGKDLLRTLARTAIAAEMFDQLGQPRKDWRQQEEQSAPTHLYDAVNRI